MRMALGATPSNVLRLLLRDGLILTFGGLTAGLALAALVTPLLALFLAGVEPHDITSFAFVAAILIVTALVASYGPARRGMGLSPIDALRRA
jgi:putative ABC transport system permease protein